MGLFNNLDTEGLEAAKDYVPSGGIFESDIYEATIKVAYAGKANNSKAQSLNVVFKIENREYRETLWVTDKEAKNYYIRDGKKHGLPGFNMADAICMMVTDKGLGEQDDEEKTVKIYDFDAKEELPKSVPVLPELTDKKIYIAIMKVRENKTKKGSNGEYELTSEERVVNVIDAVFHPEMKITLAEARDGKVKPEYWEKWSERNKGQERDRRKFKAGTGGQSGRPSSSSAPSTPPQAGAPATARKSLFGKG